MGDGNNDGIDDFIQGYESEEAVGLTVSTPAQEYFDEYFDAYREALVVQRDKVGGFQPLPDVVTYPSATDMNLHLTTKAPTKLVDVFDTYIEYLDEFKEQVDGALKKIRAQDQA